MNRIGIDINEYSKSLINNLSLLSGLVLMPDASDMTEINRCLGALINRGVIAKLDEKTMMQLINGSKDLNVDPIYHNLKTVLKRIPVKKIT